MDASSTLTWLYGEGRDPHALGRKVDALAPVVPPLWRLEVLNSMLRRQRAGKSSPAELRTYLDALQRFPVEVLPDAADQSLARLFGVARPHQLSSYDAVYLDAALRIRLPLLTHDRNLRLAAEAEGVELL